MKSITSRINVVLFGCKLLPQTCVLTVGLWLVLLFWRCLGYFMRWAYLEEVDLSGLTVQTWFLPCLCILICPGVSKQFQAPASTTKTHSKHSAFPTMMD